MQPTRCKILLRHAQECQMEVMNFQIHHTVDQAEHENRKLYCRPRDLDGKRPQISCLHSNTDVPHKLTKFLSNNISYQIVLHPLK